MFRARDVERIVSLLHVPLVFLTRTGPVALITAEAIANNVEALLKRYGDVGAVNWHFQINGDRAIGEGIVQADLTWRFLDSGGREVFSCDTTYILTGESASTGRVMAVVVHNETEEYRKAVARREAGNAGT